MTESICLSQNHCQRSETIKRQNTTGITNKSSFNTYYSGAADPGLYRAVLVDASPRY
jgi:hypothetical protein